MLINCDRCAYKFYRCPTCGVGYTTQYDLKRHQRGHRIYICDCGQEFKNWTQLQAHTVLSHPAGKMDWNVFSCISLYQFFGMLYVRLPSLPVISTSVKWFIFHNHAGGCIFKFMHVCILNGCYHLSIRVEYITCNLGWRPLKIWVFVVGIAHEFIFRLDVMCAHNAMMGLKCLMLWMDKEEMPLPCPSAWPCSSPYIPSDVSMAWCCRVTAVCLKAPLEEWVPGSSIELKQ